MSALKIEECVIVHANYILESSCKHSGIFVAFSEVTDTSTSEKALEGTQDTIQETRDGVSKIIIKMFY